MRKSNIRKLTIFLILLVLINCVQCKAYPNLNSQEKSLKKAIKEEPNNPALYFKLGMVYETQGKDGKAKEVLKQAITLDSKHAKAHNLLGNIYYDEKDYKSAVEHYQKAIQIDKAFMEPYVMLSALYRHTNINTPDEKLIEKQLILLREGLTNCNITNDRNYCISILNNISVLILENRNYDKNINMYNVIEYAGQGLELLKDEEELNKYAEYYINKNKIKFDRGMFYYHLGDAYKELNNFSNASDAYNKSLSEFRQIKDKYWIGRIEEDMAQIGK